MKIVSRPQFEYQSYERKNGSKFIKIFLYINDADGYIEVGRINQIKSWWTDQGYGAIEEIEYELSNNAKVAEFVAKTQPTLLSANDKEEAIPVNAFAKMRKIIQSSIKEQGLSASEVKEMLSDEEEK